MKRLIALVSVVVLTLSLAVPGLAKPGNRPPGPERDGHTCGTSPLRDGSAAFNTTWDGSAPLVYRFLPGEPSLCIDLTNDAPATMTITVTGSQNANSVGGNVKDSYPGDVCALFDMIDLRDATTGSTSVSIPGSAIDACGTLWTDDLPSLVSSVVVAFSGKYQKLGSDAFIDVTITMTP